MDATFQSENVFVVGVCHNCRIPRTFAKSLMRCGGCQLVAYCSRHCQKDDRCNHKYICKVFPVVNGKNVLHTTRPWEEHIAILRTRLARLPESEIGVYERNIFFNPRVCKTCHESQQDRLTDCVCNFVSYCSRICSKADRSHDQLCGYYGEQILTRCDASMQLSYPMSLAFALKFTCPYKVILNVHVVTSNPVLDLNAWELGFLRMRPEIKHLKLTFVIQGNDLESTALGEGRNGRDRLITYSIHNMYYHMFFSSPKYTEPDVVVVYGNSREMLSKKDDVHTEISYRNMTCSRDTTLVLTDATELLLEQGVKAVNAARPVDQLMPSMINALKGWGTNQNEYNTIDRETNEKYYFTCLRRK